MKRKLKIVLAYFISIIPGNYFRCLLYRYIFNYKIDKSFIGWRTIIVVKEATLYCCSIGGNNKFIGAMSILIDKNAKIGPSNTFHCGWWIKDKKYIDAKYEANLWIESDTYITSNHYFDVVGLFKLGKKSWIAGNSSQFWTHGAGAYNRNIVIGENCYIGSAVRFAPGSSIADNTLVGLGSVVTKTFQVENIILAGQPAKIIRENYNWKSH